MLVLSALSPRRPPVEQSVPRRFPSPCGGEARERVSRLVRNEARVVVEKCAKMCPPTGFG